MRYCLPFVSRLALYSLLPSFRFKRLLAATRVAASGCKWLQVAARPLALAAPRIPLQGKLKKYFRGKTFFQGLWRRAIGTDVCNPMPSSPLRPLALAAHCSHLRPLAATCSSSPLRPLAATCGHLRPLEWLQVPAVLKFKYRAFCNLNDSF